MSFLPQKRVQGRSAGSFPEQRLVIEPSDFYDRVFYKSKMTSDCVTENKQPEAETSLVYDVLIRVIKKESASSTSVEKKKRNKTCEACEV